MRWALALSLVGCAPMATQTRTIDHVTSRDHITERAGEDTITGSVRPTADTLIVEARSEKHCREVEVEHVELHREVTRTAYKPVLVGEILFAIGFSGAGGFLIYDNRNDRPDRVLAPDVTPQTGRAIGISLASIGGLLLLASTIDGFRARDHVEDAGTTERRHPTSAAMTTCGERPLGSVAIAGVSPAGEVALGTTSADGRLTLAWDALPPVLVEGANPRPEARLIARTGDRTWPLGQVSLEVARRTVATRARQEAERANSPEQWDALATRFPDEHGAEAARRARDLRFQRVREALAAGDVAAARVQVGAVEQRYKDDPETKSLVDEITAREATAARDAAWKRADDAVAGLDASAPGDRFAAADAALRAAEALAPDPRGAGLAVRLDRARAERLKDALSRIRKQKPDQYEVARSALADAELLAPADADVIKAKAAVDALELASLRTRIRARVAAKDYAEADALLARALELRPSDAALAKERTRIAALAAKQATTLATVAKTEPPKTEAGNLETKTQPTKTEPTKTEPAKIEPAKTEPTKTEPAKTTAAITSQAPHPEVTTPVPRQVQTRATMARADAKYRLRQGAPRDPIEWISLPADCIGQFFGAQVVVQCEADVIMLRRTDLDVELSCSAKSCARCKELQRGLVPRGKVDPSSERCQEPSP